jgi:hypothetical protein
MARTYAPSPLRAIVLWSNSSPRWGEIPWAYLANRDLRTGPETKQADDLT